MPVKNQALFQRVYGQITQHPETHNQAEWEDQGGFCGTTRCVGGWAIVLYTGDTSVYDGAKRLDSGGRYVRIAQGILGLTDAEADLLFYGTEDAEAVEVVGAWAEGLVAPEWFLARLEEYES